MKQTNITKLRKRISRLGKIKSYGGDNHYRYYSTDSLMISSVEIEVLREHCRIISVGNDNEDVLSVLIEVLPKSPLSYTKKIYSKQTRGIKK